MVHVGEFIIGDEEKKAILDVLDSGRITEGANVREFEKAFAKYTNSKYSVLVNSGTSGLIAGLKALDYNYSLLANKRNKVITSPLTYVADANAIVLAGFEPVFVDVDPDTYIITPENIQELLDSSDNPESYSIILPVHLMGNPCDMDKLQNIADEYDLKIFEDSAQAHGSLYKGRKTGSLADLSIFSFYVAHNIQVGEMGAVNTDDRELYRLLIKIKANGRACDCPVCLRSEGKCPSLSTSDSYSKDPRFSHEMIGYNFKVMEFQAALGLVQLRKADNIMQSRLDNVKYLNEKLSSYSEIIQLPVFGSDISYLAYTIVIKKPEIISRNSFQKKLEESGIETRPLFGCIPTQQISYEYLKEKYDGKLINADYLGKNAFYIGCHQYLTKGDLDTIVEAFEKILDPVI